MEKIVIKGGKKLNGTVTISGAKNAAVAIIPACLLINEVCRLENLPDIKDVKLFLDILKNMGAEVTYVDKNTVDINCANVQSYEPDEALTAKMRGSSYLIGALLGRFNRCVAAPPGGCDFGTRPIDQHLKGFRALGAECELAYGKIHAEAEKLVGANIYFDVITVGATVNVMLAAVRAEGMTIIENAAKEPHIVDLANFLNAMGAKIRGAGTDTIKITGVKQLHGGVYSIIPDQIEAGTFMIAAAACRGDVTLNNVIPRHLEPISAKLMEAGAKVEEFDDKIRVYVPEGAVFKKINFIALPYPGFPTDMQPQMVTFLSTVDGTSTAREGVWDDRFRYVAELKRMGADISVEGKLAIINGVPRLMGTSVRATDLRAGAAMIIAGLMADGVTEINDIHHIDRGYENFEDKFIRLGGDIRRVQVVSEFY
ncbi:MAG TPA: UDP-N-acetylglucosamine 1-carboxyvinyltransferase [Candidatus Avimonoglobus intestinipullorum]|uniref:UDP-N-acetylglucosamine 1-carboxyvinyltransferase n=1 Tax=Candidatus Avimonoglobus intestinipullorum TaxID=2840699 RepID=A0A9D1S753_9FIRM|nr:UDP-N-acetylglucosamine 1-carboxyvinyltransferase [Candidatus Avimonoglobus intestinipullorum]